MDKNNTGPFSQRNLEQMGDGHTRGHQEIRKEGSFGKTKNEDWKQYVLKDTSNGKPTPPSNKQPNVNKELWKDKVVTTKTAFDKQKPSQTKIKQIERPKQITKSK